MIKKYITNSNVKFFFSGLALKSIALYVINKYTVHNVKPVLT